MSHLPPLSAIDARARVDRGALLLDVRSEAGREASGAIEGATIVAKADVAAFAETLDKQRDVVIFCGTTAGSGPVADFLEGAGFTAVSHVEGGFEALREATRPEGTGDPA
jgi:rhodanese-related sulfurtransferase